MTELECEWVQWNLVSEYRQEEDFDEITAWKGLVMAVQDPKTWLLMGILYSVSPRQPLAPVPPRRWHDLQRHTEIKLTGGKQTYIVGTLVNFFPSVVSGLGFPRTTTLLLTAPPFILCVFTMLANGFHSDRQQERFLHIVAPLVITLAASIIAVHTKETYLGHIHIHIHLQTNIMLLLQPMLHRHFVVALTVPISTRQHLASNDIVLPRLFQLLQDKRNGLWCRTKQPVGGNFRIEDGDQ